MMKLTKREIFWLAHKYAKRLEGDSFFVIDEQGRFLQCEWNGTLRKKQYLNY